MTKLYKSTPSNLSLDSLPPQARMIVEAVTVDAPDDS